jgi:hypothetical protein
VAQAAAFPSNFLPALNGNVFGLGWPVEAALEVALSKSALHPEASLALASLHMKSVQAFREYQVECSRLVEDCRRRAVLSGSEAAQRVLAAGNCIRDLLFKQVAAFKAKWEVPGVVTLFLRDLESVVDRSLNLYGLSVVLAPIILSEYDFNATSPQMQMYFGRCGQYLVAVKQMANATPEGAARLQRFLDMAIHDYQRQYEMLGRYGLQSMETDFIYHIYLAKIHGKVDH